MPEKIVDWGWSLVLLVLGAVGTMTSRWLSMLHKHEKQLILLEADQANRTAVAQSMMQSMAEMNTRLEVHRKESVDRMEALRRDLRDDFKTLIEFHNRQDERDRSRG